MTHGERRFSTVVQDSYSATSMQISRHAQILDQNTEYTAEYPAAATLHRHLQLPVRPADEANSSTQQSSISATITLLNVA